MKTLIKEILFHRKNFEKYIMVKDWEILINNQT